MTRCALGAGMLLTVTQCAQPMGPPPGAVGNRVEHVERMAPVTDVPYTGDTEYIHAAQRYTTESRFGPGWGWRPW